MKNGQKNIKKVLIVPTQKVFHKEHIVKEEKNEILMSTQEHLKWPEDKGLGQGFQSPHLNQIR